MLQRKTKSQRIYDKLFELLASGHFNVGARFPSEAELVKEYNASRPTVARALNRLVEANLLERRAGSGTYVKATRVQQGILGLFVPNLSDTEILDPIYKQIATLAERNGYSLLLSGSSDSSGTISLDAVISATARLLDNQMAGAFFAPYELVPNASQLNQYVMKAFASGGVPVVLIDRDIVGFPERSRHDLIGIDNFRAGYIMARHLLSLYRERIDFVVRPYSATTEIERIKGYQEALRHVGIEPSKKWVHYHDPSDTQYFAQLVRNEKVRNFVCGNDWTAVDLIVTLEELGYPVPTSTHVVGFDDVKYARFLKTPLTTYRQPSAEIAAVAVQALLDRIKIPDLPPRHVTLDGSLEVRSSCGALP